MERPNYRQRERIRARLKAINAPCAICGRPIDWSLNWWVDPRDGKRKRHPLSGEYDHVVPFAIAKDSDPEVNSFSNAQAVHRICNQRKSDGTPRGRGKPKEGHATPQRDEAGALPVSRAW